MERIFDTRATTLPVLRYVVALAQERHFGRAAEACSVAQPTLSEQVGRWERRLGITVFQRDGRNLQITAQGAAIIEHATRALRELELLEAVAGPGEPPFFGPLRLGVIMSLGASLLPRVGPAIQTRYPDLYWPVIEGLTNGLLAECHERRLDAVVLAMVPEVDERFARAPIGDEPFVLAVSAGHPLATCTAVSAEDLPSEELLLLDDGHCLRSQALDLCGMAQRHASDHGADYRAASLETLRQLVALGRGITLLPAMVASMVSDPRVCLIPLRDQQARRQLILAWRHDDHRGAAFRELAATIAGACQLTQASSISNAPAR